jgi:hypothetical protein
MRIIIIFEKATGVIRNTISEKEWKIIRLDVPEVITGKELKEKFITEFLSQQGDTFYHLESRIYDFAFYCNNFVHFRMLKKVIIDVKKTLKDNKLHNFSILVFGEYPDSRYEKEFLLEEGERGSVFTIMK